MNNHSEILKNFGPRASDYRLSSTHGNPVDLERMIQLLKPTSDAVALDVATGGGHTALALAKYVNKVVAIDITPEMLSEAKKAAASLQVHNVDFVMNDIHLLSFSNEQFDIVVSRFAIHHFSNVKKALKEMCRVLKPGGKFYVLDCSVYDGEESEREFNRLELLRDSSHQCSYSPRQWKELLKELPLAVEDLSFLREEYKLPQWFDRMDTDQGNRREIFCLLDELSEDCKSHYPYGPDFITTYRLEILATKL
ncbi:methyltransferase domain-containing protein [Desulfosporosinus sp. PR]|uniref:class I SAM-dependent methyltransferase n=1 Tax=Candidatus Desulfosporosinus nitrosoreducens TaxID=3401928 RepID=UPI0028001E4B|nr:methyltransferase domain-containing protein [Desulfosporosinus sp. PR]MDQ7093494.1 methyltransferase domain-containing protein [Desulfosporosinus sp. PR]